MTLSAGARLGPYEVVALLGAGGMGEVYRARDPRLGRDVAIKLVHPRFSADAEQLRRFEQEARAASQLDHPNILVVHDIGSHEGSPYIVSELLEGESLREKLGAPLPSRKAIEYAVQVAHGLAAAHDNGIVHRDLKPENLFVTRDGRIKILDFGIAKLVQPSIPSVSLTEAATAAPPTEPGVVMGTVAYMSPEQVQGKPVDQRSDLFSLGVILYEMLAGRRPFQKETAVEMMAAILREEPPELSETNRAVSPGLERIVKHCLEKEPSSRFQSARDLGFDLESLSQSTTAGTAALRPVKGKRRLAIRTLAIALLATAGAGLFVWGKHSGRAPVSSFKRITLRRGNVGSARFTPDFQSVVYSASWQGKPAELFVQRLASPDARSLGVIDASVAGTAGGDVAILREDGTLAQLPLEGGTPRDLLNNLDEATWDRSGTRFAIVRRVGGHQRLEYPAGKVLVETTGTELIGSPRLSPDGKRIAFAFHPGVTGPPGDVCVVDASGRKRTLLKNWAGVSSLAWSPDGSEVWFSATKAGVSKRLYAVTLAGKERLIANLPGSLLLQDIAADGRVLVSYGEARRWELRGRMAGDTAERDLSWLDGTLVPTLSPDGTQMVFQEWGEGGGEGGATYHWRVGDPAPKRLGDGAPWDVSPDWTTVLIIAGGPEYEVKLVPIGAGETRTLPRGSVRSYVWGAWNPDGKRIVFLGADADGQMRLFVQDVAGGLPRPFAKVETKFGSTLFTSDGRFFAQRPKEGAPVALWPIDGGEPRPIPFLKADEFPLAFSDDGQSLFVADSFLGSKFPLHVARLDLKTGRRAPWLAVAPPDQAGVPGRPYGVWVTPNGRFYAYGYFRRLSDLYVVEGLK